MWASGSDPGLCGHGWASFNTRHPSSGTKGRPGTFLGCNFISREIFLCLCVLILPVLLLPIPICESFVCWTVFFPFWFAGFYPLLYFAFDFDFCTFFVLIIVCLFVCSSNCLFFCFFSSHNCLFVAGVPPLRFDLAPSNGHPQLCCPSLLHQTLQTHQQEGFLQSHQQADVFVWLTSVALYFVAAQTARDVAGPDKIHHRGLWRRGT